MAAIELILLFFGLHVVAMALGATMLLYLLREDRRWSSGDNDEERPWRRPTGRRAADSAGTARTRHSGVAA